MRKSKIYIVFKGTDKEFTGDLKQIANNFNINYTTLTNRLYNLKMNIEDAIEYKYIKKYTVFENTDREFSGSINDIAEHFNINYNTLIERIYKMSLTIEEAIEYKNSNKIYTVFKDTNKEFTGTIKEIANHFNIKYITLYGRVTKQSLSFEDAITKNNTYTVFKGTDKEFIGNKKEIADHFGINYSTLNSRIKTMSLSLEEIIDYEFNKKSNIITVFKGTDKEFTGNLKEISNNFKINYNTLINRMNRFSLSVEEAIEYKNTSSNNIYTVYKGTDKEFTGNLFQIANHFNLKYEAIKSRVVKQSMSIEEAIEIPLKRVNQKNLTYKGKAGTLKELCKLFNKNYTEVYNLLKYSHTLEYAMENTKTAFKKS